MFIKTKTKNVLLFYCTQFCDVISLIQLTFIETTTSKKEKQFNSIKRNQYCLNELKIEISTKKRNNFVRYFISMNYFN